MPQKKAALSIEKAAPQVHQKESNKVKQTEFLHLDWLSPNQSQPDICCITFYYGPHSKNTANPCSYKQSVTNSYVLVTPLRSNMPPKHTKATDEIVL